MQSRPGPGELDAEGGAREVAVGGDGEVELVPRHAGDLHEPVEVGHGDLVDEDPRVAVPVQAGAVTDPVEDGRADLLEHAAKGVAVTGEVRVLIPARVPRTAARNPPDGPVLRAGLGVD